MFRDVKKKNVGIICGHNHDEMYTVEFKDVCGDVCEECFIKHNINNACDMTPETQSPYKGNLTDYWYDGTLNEFTSELIHPTLNNTNDKIDVMESISNMMVLNDTLNKVTEKMFNIS